MRKELKGLKRSIVVFFILATITFYIIINKGHIGSYALVKLDESAVESSTQENIAPKR